MSDSFSLRGSERSAESGESGRHATEPPARRRLRELMADSDQDEQGEASTERAGGWRERIAGVLRRALPDPGRAGCLGTSAVAVLGCLVFAFGWGSGNEPARVPVREPTTVDPVSTTTAATESIVVSVVGRVHRPGLITLDGGARVAQALRAAGGPLPDTDTLGLNLARQLSDGEQLYVGVEPPEEASSGGKAEGTERSTVDLNEAGERELRELPGVGPVTADSILRWRAEHGPFASVEQLREVDGIGPATLARLRELVRA